MLFLFFSIFHISFLSTCSFDYVPEGQKCFLYLILVSVHLTPTRRDSHKDKTAILKFYWHEIIKDFCNKHECAVIWWGLETSSPPPTIHWWWSGGWRKECRKPDGAGRVEKGRRPVEAQRGADGALGGGPYKKRLAWWLATPRRGLMPMGCSWGVWRCRWGWEVRTILKKKNELLH